MGIYLIRKKVNGEEVLVSPYWHYSFKIKGYVQQRGSTKKTNKKSAERVYHKRMDEFEDRVKNGAPVRWTVRKLLEWVWKYHWSRKPRMKEKKLLSMVAKFLKTFGSRVASEIKHQEILDYRFEREKTVSSTTTSREFTVLRHAYKRAIKAKLLRDNPFDGIEQAKPRRRDRTATPEEQAYIFDKSRGVFHFIIRFALATGLRKGEMETLLKTQVDVMNKEIRVVSWKGKGEEPHTRYVPIDAEALEILTEMGKHPYPTVFYNGDRKRYAENKQIKPNGLIHSAWPRLMSELGIPDLTFHDLRHTFATELWRKTGDILKVHRILGHEKLDTTLIYLNLKKSDLAYHNPSTMAGQTTSNPLNSLDDQPNARLAQW